ncbi:hypothetical protein [Pedobacter sp. MC2016-05]|uniref:hypothetical protein n=1 Tax=Pedobacter sp. MC2016-05 TaxID=2994474 RepID=UPI002AFE997D|nr:hypothetical protein [Pedobacter sp. MC2016-05]
MKKLIFSAVMLCISIFANGQSETLLTIKPVSNQVVSKHIYGHFSEHLGRCIYDGFWVDENSTIPNKGRIRLDIVEALKRIKCA